MFHCVDYTIQHFSWMQPSINKIQRRRFFLRYPRSATPPSVYHLSKVSLHMLPLCGLPGCGQWRWSLARLDTWRPWPCDLCPWAWVAQVLVNITARSSIDEWNGLAVTAVESHCVMSLTEARECRDDISLFCSRDHDLRPNMWTWHVSTEALPKKLSTSRLLKVKQDAQLSQRDRAAGCIIVFVKSRRLELWDNDLRTL